MLRASDARGGEDHKRERRDGEQPVHDRHREVLSFQSVGREINLAL